MLRGYRLRLNLVNKYRVSGVVYDLAYIISVGQSLLPRAYYSNKWYQEPCLDWILRRYGDHRGSSMIVLDGRCETAQCGTRWSMAAIDYSIGGVGHSKQEAWTV
jgi:hypothetical protein